MKKRVARVLAVLLTAGASSLCVAQGRDFHHPDPHEPWHGDIKRFRDHDLSLWRAGRWFHGRHDGRLGWWWIVGDAWYFYPARILPYPDPYQPPELPPPPAPGPYWYYCPNPAGYYPYVAQCVGNWQRIPSTPWPAPR